MPDPHTPKRCPQTLSGEWVSSSSSSTQGNPPHRHPYLLKGSPLYLVSGGIAGRDVDSLGGDVEVLEEVHLHEAVVGLQGIWGHGEVLVQVEGCDMAEGQPGPVGLDQVPVDVHGGGACGKAQHAPLSCKTEDW